MLTLIKTSVHYLVCIYQIRKTKEKNKQPQTNKPRVSIRKRDREKCKKGE